MTEYLYNSVIILLILSFLLLMLFYYRTDIFKQNSKTVLKKIKEFNKGVGKNKSVFNDMLGYLIIALFIIISTLILFWVEFKLKGITSYVISFLSLVGFFFMNYKSFKKNIKGTIIFYLMILPLYIMFYVQKQLLPPLILSGLIVGIGIHIKVADLYKKIRRKIPEIEKNNYSIFELIKTIIKVSKKLANTKRFKREVFNTQAFSIAIIVLLFVVFPKIDFLFTQNIIEHINSAKNYLLNHKDQIPYYVFGIYLILSITLSVEFIQKFYKSEKEKFIVKFYNILVFFIMLTLMLPYTVICFLIYAIIIGLGNAILGIDFAIVLGFFVFPNWIAKLHSYQIAIFVMTLPQLKILNKRIVR